MNLALSFRDEIIVLDDPLEALRFRASLPGAFAYDHAAQLFRTLQADGTNAVELLPAAFPATWLVNARATSQTFAAWLREPTAWQSLLRLLPFDASLEDARSLDRGGIENALSHLMRAQGATLASITKVLALLRPQLIPIMHDAVVAKVTGAMDPPTKGDTETASPSLFFDVLLSFEKMHRDLQVSLMACAKAYELAVLDAPQVLDRLLWWAAWGQRYAR